MTRINGRSGRIAWALAAGLLCGPGAWSAAAQTKENAEGEGKDKAPEVLCPVMGEQVDFSVSVLADDGPVYFCCERCIKKYEQDTEKYAAAVKKQREALAKMPKVQVVCPVTGEPIDRKVSVEHDGEKVYFCCKKCVDAFQKDAKKYRAKLAASYTYQTICPVGGHEIDPSSRMELTNGQKVYFCCDGCKPKFLADPAKYAEKMKEQGVSIDIKKLPPEKKG